MNVIDSIWNNLFLSLSRYACAWRRLSPCTDGLSGEAKDLWVFYFTDLPDISDKLTEGLQGVCVCALFVCCLFVCLYVFHSSIFFLSSTATEEGSGSWEDGMTPESSTMLYRSLHNIIERCVFVCGSWLSVNHHVVLAYSQNLSCVHSRNQAVDVCNVNCF